MKRIIYTIIAISLAYTVQAQYAMLHGTGGVQVFEGIAALSSAYDASAEGDTIYLSGGGFTAPATFNKSLIIFGVGHYADYTANKTKTIISGTVNLSENADNFRMEGVEIAGSIYFGTDEGIDNVLIRYCTIKDDINVRGTSGTNPSHNLAIVNCVVNREILLDNAVNTVVNNSIVIDQIKNSYGNTIANNILMFNYTGVGSSYSIHGDNNICNNNIFLQSGSKCVTGTSNQIHNNLFVHASPSLGTSPVSSGNYTGIAHETIFVNQSGYAFSYEHDYNLDAPGTYPGVDGSQVGIYGGGFPYKEGAIPSNPHFESVDISSTTTPDGKLHIEIKATAQ